jgi:hypothetical protein
VAASVTWLPNELFLVVIAIKLARASNETDKIIKEIRISIKVKPFDFIEYFKVIPP